MDPLSVLYKKRVRNEVEKTDEVSHISLASEGMLSFHTHSSLHSAQHMAEL